MENPATLLTASEIYKSLEYLNSSLLTRFRSDNPPMGWTKSETVAILEFVDTKSTEKIEEILLGDGDLTHGFRFYLAGIITGSIGRRKGRNNSFKNRDLWIYLAIEYALNANTNGLVYTKTSLIDEMASHINRSKRAIDDAYNKGMQIFNACPRREELKRQFKPISERNIPKLGESTSYAVKSPN